MLYSSWWKFLPWIYLNTFWLFLYFGLKLFLIAVHRKKKKKAQKKRIDFVSHLPPTSKLLRCVLHSSVFMDGRKKRERGEVRGSPMNNHSLITNSTSLFFQTSNTWLILFPSERIIVYLISPSREVTTYLRLSLSCFCIIFVGLQYFKIRATKAGLVTIQNMTNYGFRE